MAAKRKTNRRPRRRNSDRPRRTSKKYRKYERTMQRFIQDMMRDLQDAFKKVVLPQIDLLAINFKEEPDTKFPLVRLDEGEGEILTRLINLVEAQFLGFYSEAYIRANLDRFFKSLDIDLEQDVAREFARQNITVLQANTQDIVTNSIQNSLGKIQNLQTTTIGQLRDEISRGLVQGQRWETIAKRINRSMTAPDAKGQPPTPFKKASNRAKFIARNEVGTALGTLNKERQQEVGVQLYRWQTAEDERVRTSHKDLNGKLFSWQGDVTVNGVEYSMANDPETGFYDTIPGEPYNCRCVAIPYIPEFDEEEND